LRSISRSIVLLVFRKTAFAVPKSEDSSEFSSDPSLGLLPRKFARSIDAIQYAPSSRSGIEPAGSAWARAFQRQPRIDPYSILQNELRKIDMFCRESRIATGAVE